MGYPAWLDVAIDRCPICGGAILIEEDAEGWEVGCVAGGGCAAVYAGAGDVPTWAGWMALTALGRWQLHGLGHPLGVAR